MSALGPWLLPIWLILATIIARSAYRLGYMAAQREELARVKAELARLDRVKQEEELRRLCELPPVAAPSFPPNLRVL